MAKKKESTRAEQTRVSQSEGGSRETAGMSGGVSGKAGREAQIGKLAGLERPAHRVASWLPLETKPGETLPGIWRTNRSTTAKTINPLEVLSQ